MSIDESRADVWSRWGHVYRVRAILLLALTLVLFSGVCAFAYWLRTGTFLAPVHEGYFDVLALTFRFTGHTGITLASFLVGPMKVTDVPALIPIVGLLIASIVTIPVLVAILYRFPACLPFILAVGGLAVMPWLAVTLLGCCVLASCRPFRQRSRFMSALIGLLPVILYFVLASRGTKMQVGELTDPLHRIAFVAPWVIAIVAGAVLIALVLLIARLVNLRPGSIAPIMALMFCLPVILFEFQVGRDEYHYRLLEQSHAGFFADRRLSPLDGDPAPYAAAVAEFFSYPEPRPRFEDIYQRQLLHWSLIKAGLGNPDAEEFLKQERSVLTDHQQTFARQCEAFLRYYPQSRHAAGVLYLKASALSMRVDMEAFRHRGWILFRDDFPSPAAELDWKRLVYNFPESGYSCAAMLHLAQIEARRGEVEQARTRLKTLLAGFPLENVPPAADPASAGAFESDPEKSKHEASHVRAERNLPAAGRRVYLLQARRLSDMIEFNDDPVVGFDPLCGSRVEGRPSFGLLDIVPWVDTYVPNLQILKTAYAGSSWEDNIELELARTIEEPEARIIRLSALIEACAEKQCDAEPEARFLLASVYQQLQRPGEAAEQLERLIRRFPTSIWASEARPMLAALTPEFDSGGSR